MKIAQIPSFLMFLATSSWAAESHSDFLLKTSCLGSEFSSVKTVSEIVCLKDNKYQLKYDYKSRKIVLVFDRRKMSLQQFSKGRDPALVGADKLIGFLPNKLQIYKKSNILLYISAFRTNSGAGGGQCGAGSEIYLNFLSLEKPVPRVSSSVLIGSCDYSIELDNQTIPDGEFGEISVEGEKLLLHFLNYRGMEGSPVATITPDGKKLVFNN